MLDPTGRPLKAAILALFGMSLTTSCEREDKSARIHFVATSEKADSSGSDLPVVPGSVVFLAESAPVELAIYIVDDGARELVHSIRLDPSTAPLAFATPRVSGDKGFLELGAWERRAMDGSVSFVNRQYKEVELPALHRIGTSHMVGSLQIQEPSLIAHYWIHEKEGVTHSPDEVSSLAAMLEASKTKAASFIVIEGNPVDSQP